MFQKTTWAGIVAIASSIALIASTGDVNAAIPGFVSGLGLIFAGDSKNA